MEKSEVKGQFKKGIIVFASILGFLASASTLYLLFLPDKTPRLEIQIVSSLNVLDIREDVSKLDVVYDDRSLKELNSNIKIYNIRIINNGKKTILSNYYDGNAPVMIVFQNGEIIGNVEKTHSSNEYLEQVVEVEKTTDNTIQLPEVILESSEFYEIKLLILYKNTSELQLIVDGKIADQYAINIIDKTLERKEQNVFEAAFLGNIVIQIIRSLVYTVAVIIFTILILTISGFVADRFGRIRRKKEIRRFINDNSIKKTSLTELLFDKYINEGEHIINNLKETLENTKDIDKYIKSEIKRLEKRKSEEQGYAIADRDLSKYILEKSTHEQFLDLGLVNKNGGRYMLNDEIVNILIEFGDYLKKN